MAPSTFPLPLQLFINNQYMDASSQQTLTLTNPHDSSLITSQVQSATAADIDKAVAGALAAFHHDPWHTSTPTQRASCMLKFADLVEQHADSLKHLESLPTGKPASALDVDLAHMVHAYRHYARLATPPTQPAAAAAAAAASSPPPLDEKHGVCAGLASSNATFLYVAWKVAPALAAGNCFVFKSSETSPLGALALGALFAEAGFPAGVVQIVSGGRAAGEALVAHPGVAKVSFAGSMAAAGEKGFEMATRSNTKVTLELGPKSPGGVVVSDVAHLDETTVVVDGSSFLNSLEPVYADSGIARKEVFGPLLSIQTICTEEEAVGLASETEYGQTAAVYTNNVTRALGVSSGLESAMTSPSFLDLHTPFGGDEWDR